jgi:hypothetical protein
MTTTQKTIPAKRSVIYRLGIVSGRGLEITIFLLTDIKENMSILVAYHIYIPNGWKTGMSNSPRSHGLNPEW